MCEFDNKAMQDISKYPMALFSHSILSPGDISEQLGILTDFIASVRIEEGHHQGLVLFHKIISDTLLLLADRLNAAHIDRLLREEETPMIAKPTEQTLPMYE